jgi:hypothetical protein
MLMYNRDKVKNLNERLKVKYMKNLIIRVIKETMKDPVKREKVLNYVKPIISNYTNKNNKKK